MSDIEGRLQIECVWEEGTEKNIWIREEVSSWRKLRKEELHNLYSSRNIIRVIN
jgi:hypothetical protein